jgi:spore germination cell wall hydrolase CwlJ-like protein
MNALHFICRWLSIVFLFNLLILIIVFTFIVNIPHKETTIVEQLPLETIPIKYGLYRQLNNKEINCLADNIFFEAGNQSDLGKKAVAYVTLNRMYSTNFPENICSIVYQKSNNVCQFSWVCKSRSLRNRKNKEYVMWQRSLAIANQAVHDYNIYDDPTHGALHFHADYVKPFWSKVYYRTTKIDNHIFYRPRYGT